MHIKKDRAEDVEVEHQCGVYSASGAYIHAHVLTSFMSVLFSDATKKLPNVNGDVERGKGEFLHGLVGVVLS